MTVTRARFAPSPTGWLHVGNAYIAVANALFARHTGGELLLRLDDTDVERSREEYARGIEQDLAWLGVTWTRMFRQSDRLAAYALAADRLRASGHLYPCFESEEELAAKREVQRRRHQTPIYDRAALAMTAEQRARAEASGRKPYWRFRLSQGEQVWDDLVLGKRGVKLAAVSDPVLVRADGSPLYTFTSVVDDIAEGVTHVIRGEDHITNSGVQRDIMSALGADADAVRLAHRPLLLDAEGGKLSKRLDSLSLRRLRADGIEPAALFAYLARLGTPDAFEPASVQALAESFDFARMSAAAPRFDPAQLLALNRRVLHAAPYEAVASRLPPDADPRFWEAVRGNLDLVSEARHWWEVVTGEACASLPEEAAFLRLALTLLPAEPWDGDVWGRWTNALREASGRGGRALFHPLRLALTGEEKGPELRALLPLIGRARAARRLAAAAG
ncbi:MAG: glutamate--tRNA ligase [Rhodospirillales bacterium]|nr:glutamate--tRNA ligase [Rhodospirillales bacterium]